MLHFPKNIISTNYYYVYFNYVILKFLTNCKIAATILQIVLMSIAENPRVLQAINVA